MRKGLYQLECLSTALHWNNLSRSLRHCINHDRGGPQDINDNDRSVGKKVGARGKEEKVEYGCA